MSVRKSSAIFGAVVVALLIVCVGLLIALLKNQPEKPTSEQHTTLSPFSTTPSDDPKYRLPEGVTPSHYKIYLHPNLEDAEFNGTVDIDVTTVETVQSFTVHVNHDRLTVKTYKVFNSAGVQLTVAGSTKDENKQFFIINMKHAVPPGEYKLQYDFEGKMAGSNVGFYVSSYTQDGETRKLATSKFQPTYARQAFPCFDQPNYKTRFDVTLAHGSEYRALSNMPVKDIKNKTDDILETVFQTSERMVTYLACFIVCDFDYLQNYTAAGLPFRVYSTPAQVQKTKFALDNGIQMLDFYADYFNISYPLPKSDMIAIPDFQSGAMEHWGIITFRETNLLYDMKESSPRNVQRIATVVGHELAHMWFGNLVTMKWWDDLWLNEGFASYIEYKGVNHVFKEWNMLEQLLTEDLQPVMKLDATTSSHPIIQPVNNPDQITEIFDAISYNKGASVLRMLESFVGKRQFQNGISNFLKKNEFGNAETKDLWKEIDTASKSTIDITEVMDTWTKQMGFPVISVRKLERNRYAIQQKRFLINAKKMVSAAESPYNYVWKVPLFYITDGGKEGTIWINDNQTHIIEIAGDWVKFNHDQQGYYIVNYDAAEWDKFYSLLMADNSVLNPSDRSSLLFDAFMLAQGEVIRYNVPLNLAKNLVMEKNLVVWETAYSCLVQLGHLFPESHFKNFIKEVTTPLYRQLGWDMHDKHVDSLLQTTIVGLSCYSGNLECKDEASKRLKMMMEDRDPGVPTALRNTLFHYAMENGGTEVEWQYLWNKYESETSAQERIKLLYGMAHVKDHKLITRLLENTKDTNKIRSQDFYTVLTYVAGNPDGRDLVWDFVRNNWPYLIKRFTENDRDLGRAVKSICEYFNTEEKLHQMEEFFAKYPKAGAGARAREQALETVRNNIYWMNTHKIAVDNWLNENGHVPFSKFRLTGEVLPEHYDLRLRPYLDKNVFDGDVNITVRVENRTEYLIVQSHHLNITNTFVEDADGKTVPYRAAFAVPENQLWVVVLEKPALKGTILVMKFRFEGNLGNGGLVGFYRSSYKTSDGRTRYLATSQFQSTYARQAFPCFDEPQFKSTFTVHLVHENGYKAISNMPENGTIVIEPGWLETKFEKSVKMVTYLLCAIVSDFDFESKTTDKGREVRVYARPDEKSKTTYAVDVAVKTLMFFEDYFKVEYPLPKLDLIAIPDFQAGAMENWGLITFRETLLLYDKNETSAYAQLRIDAVIGHEIAHMWFGNLVTMKWWDDLWLNEGFASYMEYKSMEAIRPEWEVDAQFFFEDTHRVLIPDAAITSHPIIQPVGHPDEITAIFDAISYSKGASVLRMLEFFLGTNTFNWGVTNYLRKYAYDNAVTSDLWKCLTEQAHAEGKFKDTDVATVMDTWTLQMGYPYINVTKYSEDQDSVTYSVAPHRFLIDPRVKPDTTSPFGYKWEIPLSYRTAENSEPVIQWIASKDTTAMVTVPTKKWVKFNSDSKGYYLVNYHEEWPTIIRQLLQNHLALTPSDRANLISDVFLLARAGLTPYKHALRLTTYLKDERHFVPWETAKRSLSYLLNVLKHDSEIYPIFKEYLSVLTKDALPTVGWDNKDDHLQDRLRVTLVELSCDSGNQDCLKETKKLLDEWKDEGRELPSNIRVLVFRYGMQQSDKAMWDHMLEKYKTESSMQMQRDLLQGLAFSNNNDTLLSLLKIAENADVIREQDYFTLLGYIANNPRGLDLVWKYVQDNWQKIVDRFNVHNRYLGDAVKSICTHFATEDKLKEMNDFFTKYPDAGAGERARKDAIQTVQAAITWLSSYKESVKSFLTGPSPWTNNRLPKHVIPDHYDVKLHPLIDVGSFNGSVRIHIRTTEATYYLLVHSHELNVTSARLTEGHSLDGPEVKLASHFPHKDKQYWVLESSSQLSPGSYIIHMQFDGTLLDKLVGFYRSSYTDSTTNTTKHLATSQFQSTYARQAFPCLDEPGFRTTFNITLVHEPHMTAISNMPIQEVRKLSNGWKETTFKKSVSMVTYLVAAIVCDCDFREITTNGSVKLRVYAPKDRVHQSDFGVQTGKLVLDYFEDYFNISYPLEKLDMIALPDFRAGAMENWGLITYREVYLLYDHNETSPSVKFSIAMIIAHEIAHMWFGNLVTMEWWDDLWLNEGFATFMAYKCVDKIYPEMDGIGMFLLGELSKVLEPDATWSSHAIVTEVTDPDQIQGIFDAISYSKGASVLRKLESFLKPDVFRKGIERYLRKYEYGNARTQQLWEELQTVSPGVDVSAVMATWTEQMGYPVVTFPTGSNGIVANQTRFIMDKDTAGKEDEHPSKFNYTWSIPIHFHGNGFSDINWLKTEEGSLTDVPESTLVKFNSDHTGYYLVNYGESHWDAWAKVLMGDASATANAPNLTRYDRSNLLSDAFLLAYAGDMKYPLALELTRYMENKEDELLPWNTGKTGLLRVLGLLGENKVIYDKMKEYLQTISKTKFGQLQWNDDPNQDYIKRRLRVTVADLACRAGLPTCLNEAGTKLNDLLAGQSIPSAVRSLVYKYGLGNDKSKWDRLWEQCVKTQSAQEKRDMLIGLAYIEDKDKLAEYLEKAKNTAWVRTQDFFTVLNNVAANPMGLNLAWDFYRKQWEFLVNRYTINDGSLGGSFRSITSHFATKERLTEMEIFNATYPEAGAGKTDRKEAFEVVSSNIKWSTQYANDIDNWLTKTLATIPPTIPTVPPTTPAPNP